MRTFKKLPVFNEAAEPPRGRRHPDWIKVRIPSGENYFDVRELVHGLGLHTPEDRTALLRRDVEALAVLLGDKPFLMGAEPCGADAAVFGQIASLLAPTADGPLRQAGEAHPNLGAYRDRILARFFPAQGQYTVR